MPKVVIPQKMSTHPPTTLCHHHRQTPQLTLAVIGSRFQPMGERVAAVVLRAVSVTAVA